MAVPTVKVTAIGCDCSLLSLLTMCSKRYGNFFGHWHPSVVLALDVNRNQKKADLSHAELALIASCHQR